MKKEEYRTEAMGCAQGSGHQTKHYWRIGRRHIDPKRVPRVMLILATIGTVVVSLYLCRRVRGLTTDRKLR